MPAKSRRAAGSSKPIPNPSNATRGDLYRLCTDISPPLGGWFSLADVLGRCARSLCAVYYLVLTHPVSFFVFSCRYNHVW